MAKSSGINLMDYIDKKELKKITEPELKKVVNEIIDDMDYQSFKAIETFYHDYHPFEYDRWYSLYKMWKKPKVTAQEDGGYIIEFSWESNALSYAHEKPRNEYVFNGPFEQGYHGGPIFVVDSYKKDIKGRYVIDTYHYEDAPRMTPSPWEIIRDYAIKKYNAYERI